MVKIDNIYFNVGEEDYQIFRDTVEKCYKDRERVRLIMDLEGKKVKLSSFMKLKKVFDELGVEKLEETCVLCDDGWKKTIIKSFMGAMKKVNENFPKRPVKFL
jgi:hypothetical protein